jgi:hypothetical protein
VKEKQHKKELLMMFSNIFLVLPFLVSIIYGEIVFLFFSAGLMIFSPLFHWYFIHDTSKWYFHLFRGMDWLFASSAAIYTYVFIYKYLPETVSAVFYCLLSFLLLFFWYGLKKGDYLTLHPYFHIIASILSSAIIYAAHF